MSDHPTQVIVAAWLRYVQRRNGRLVIVAPPGVPVQRPYDLSRLGKKKGSGQ